MRPRLRGTIPVAPVSILSPYRSSSSPLYEGFCVERAGFSANGGEIPVDGRAEWQFLEDYPDGKLCSSHGFFLTAGAERTRRGAFLKPECGNIFDVALRLRSSAERSNTQRVSRNECGNIFDITLRQRPSAERSSAQHFSLAAFGNIFDIALRL
jgi:hypothetical protein